jgi:hypothetical protein
MDRARQMDPVMVCEDRAAEQLFDEMMARVYAIAELAPATQLAGAPARMHRAVAEGAQGTVSLLRRGPTADVVHRLRLLLWPCGGAPRRDDAWWCTPLGQLLAEAGMHSEFAEVSVTTIESSVA